MFVRLLALMLMYLVAPGSLEATADVVHEVVAGHTLDDDTGNLHGAHTAPAEHHCTGAFHACGCCASLVWVPTEVARVERGALRPLPLLSVAVRGAALGFVPGGVRDSVFRPPIV